MRRASRRVSRAFLQRRRDLPPDLLDPDTTRGAARLRLASLFREAGLLSPDLDARLLVCAACAIDHAGLVRDPDALLGVSAGSLGAMAHRRLAREPVSRILGRREFWGLSLAIGPAVLDPRPETEELVGSVIDAIGGQKDRPFRILDLGTGSGAILCALLADLPNAFGLGIDRSIEACRVARSNFAALGCADRAAVVGGSWTDAIRGTFDIVVSNPPYIPRGDIASLDREVRDFDPLAALDGGADGLDPYRLIAPRLTRLLTPGGIVAFECGFDQGDRVAAMLRDVGLWNVMVYRDLAGHDRIVVGSRESTARDAHPVLSSSR